jgi:Rod binding domain-containing protein
MDSTKLILTGTVPPSSLSENLSETLFYKKIAKWEPGKIDGVSEDRKKQIAKDFESVLISKLLDEMKNTIGGWSFDEDETSKQVQGIFWLYLARDIANNGGFGMWKDIYQFSSNPDQTNTTTELLSRDI